MDMEAAAAALPSLYELDLGGRLPPEEAERLAAALEASPAQLRLTAVRLANNRLSDAAVCRLATALASGPARDVQLLDLAWNSVGQAGAAGLAGALRAPAGALGLRTLDLECNDLLDAGAVELARALPWAPGLQSLKLAANRIAAGGASALATALPRAGLELLDLDRNHAGPRGAAALAEALLLGCPLQRLRLGLNRVRDTGAEALATALCGGAEERAAPRLQELNLSGNLIGDEGAASFARALSSDRARLRCLELSRNRLGPRGGEALAQALEARPGDTLQVLELHGNEGLGDFLADRIAFALRKNCLRLMVYDPVKAALERCRSGAFWIDLSGIYVGQSGARALAQALAVGRVRVSTLTLTHAYLGDSGAAELTGALCHRTISEVDLSWNGITAAGAEQLLSGVCLSSGSRLARLRLDNNDLKDVGAIAVASTLRGGQSGVPVFPALRALELGGNGIGLAGARALAEALCAPGAPKLHELELSRNPLGPTGAAALAPLLHVGRSLRSLGLAVARLRDPGAVVLGEALATRGGPATPAAGSSGTNCAPQDVALALQLRGNGVGDAGAAALARALASGAPLEFLGLQYNRVSAAGAEALVEGLRARARRTLAPAGPAPAAPAPAGPAPAGEARVDLAGNPAGPDGGYALERSLSAAQAAAELAAGCAALPSGAESGRAGAEAPAKRARPESSSD